MPNFLEHHIESGLRSHQQGDFAAAIAAYRQALALAPADLQLQGLLGTALLQAGDAASAIPLLEKTTYAQKRNAQLASTLAEAYFATAQYAKAAETFRKASRIDPQEAQFQLGLANSLAMQQQFAEARRLLDKVLARHPRHAMAWFNLGNVLRDLGEAHPAIDAYRKALAAEPGLVDARNGLAHVLHKMLRLAEAESEYRQCVREAPQFLTAHQNLASVLIDEGKFDEAEAACRAAIALDPGDVQNVSMLADTFNLRGRMHEAMQLYGEALRLAPDHHSLRLSYATKLCDTGDIEGGLREYATLLARAPDMAGLHQGLATTLLAHGYLAEGWSAYRQRPAFAAFRDKLTAVTLTQALPEDLKGRHLCVLREQGLGDEIFFLRHARVLKQRGARITYRASRAIASLLARVSEIDDIIDAEAPPPACDATIMVGDLPHALGALPAALCSDIRGVADAPAGAAWLFPWREPCYSPLPLPTIRFAALPAQMDAMRARLAALGPPPYLGITWRGGTPPSEQGTGNWALYKTLDIARLGAALKGFRGTFLALQRKPETGELDAMAAALSAPVHDFTELNNDLEAMHALLTLIDEYVGVSNTNMHLRAAAGRVARVLIPAPAEWRWMAAGKRSPWFPDFAIYRQADSGEWDAALTALARDLASA